jgi:hypothetical protein
VRVVEHELRKYAETDLLRRLQKVLRRLREEANASVSSGIYKE